VSWVEPPEDHDPHTVAEFIESELLLSGDEYLSFSELRGLHPAGRQLTDDEMSFAIAEIEARERSGGSKYPFTVIDRGVGHDSTEQGELYRFLLLLSIKGTPMRVKADYQRSDPIFDAAVREAFRNIHGKAARSLVFGWPPRDGRPGSFPRAVEWAAEQIGLEMRGGTIPDHKRDAGVDVIVWRPFEDQRSAFTIVLVQNTVQMAFVKKPRDVDPNEWRDWWQIGTAPSVGFAVPFSMPRGDIWWEDVSKAANIVLDRGRIISELDEVDASQWPEWQSLRRFVAEEIKVIRTAGSVQDSLQMTVPKGRRKTKRGA
jgi:hypothetical protein